MLFSPAVCKICVSKNNGTPPCIEAQRLADRIGRVVLRSFESPAEGGLCGYHAELRDLVSDLSKGMYRRYDRHTAIDVASDKVKRLSSHDRHSKRVDQMIEYRKRGDERFLDLGKSRYWIIRAKPHDSLYPQILRYFQQRVTRPGDFGSMGTRWKFGTFGGVSGGVGVAAGTWGTVVLEDPQGRQWRYRLASGGAGKGPLKAGAAGGPEAAPSTGFVAGFGEELDEHSFEGPCRLVDIAAVPFLGAGFTAIQANYRGPTDYTALIGMVGLAVGISVGVDAAGGSLSLMGRA